MAKARSQNNQDLPLHEIEHDLYDFLQEEEVEEGEKVKATLADTDVAKVLSTHPNPSQILARMESRLAHKLEGEPMEEPMARLVRDLRMLVLEYQIYALKHPEKKLELGAKQAVIKHIGGRGYMREREVKDKFFNAIRGRVASELLWATDEKGVSYDENARTLTNRYLNTMEVRPDHGSQKFPVYKHIAMAIALMHIGDDITSKEDLQVKIASLQTLLTHEPQRVVEDSRVYNLFADSLLAYIKKHKPSMKEHPRDAKLRERAEKAEAKKKKELEMERKFWSKTYIGHKITGPDLSDISDSTSDDEARELAIEKFQQLAEKGFRIRGINTRVELKKQRHNNAKRFFYQVSRRKGVRVGTFSVLAPEYSAAGWNPNITIDENGRVVALDQINPDDTAYSKVLIEDAYQLEELQLIKLGDMSDEETNIVMRETANLYITHPEQEKFLQTGLSRQSPKFQEEWEKMAPQYRKQRIQLGRNDSITGAELLMFVDPQDRDRVLEVANKVGINGDFETIKELQESIFARPLRELEDDIAFAASEEASEEEESTVPEIGGVLGYLSLTQDQIDDANAILLSELQTYAQSLSTIDSQLAEHILHVQQHGIADMGYLAQHDFFSSYLEGDLVNHLEDMYTDCVNHWAIEVVAKANEESVQDNRYHLFVGKYVGDSDEDVYQQHLREQMIDSEVSSFSLGMLYHQVFPVYANEHFSVDVCANAIVDLYIQQKYADRQLDYGVYELDETDPIGHLLIKLETSSQRTIARHKKPWMETHEEFLQENDEYQELLEQKETTDSKLKKLRLRGKIQLKENLLAKQRVQAREEHLLKYGSDSDADSLDLAEDIAYRKEYREMFTDYELTNKNDPLLRRFGVNSVQLSADEGDLSAVVALRRTKTIGKRTRDANDKIIVCSIDDSQLYRPESLIANILAPERTDISESEKINALWAVLKTWIRSVHDLQGIIHGDWMNQHIRMKATTGELIVESGTEVVFNERHMLELPDHARLEQIVYVYRCFLALMDTKMDQHKEQYKDIGARNLGFDDTSVRSRIQDELHNEHGDFPGVTEDYNAETQETKLELDELTRANTSLNYFYFPEQADGPQGMRTLVAAGRVYTVQGNTKTPKIIKEYPNVSEWLHDFEEYERGVALQLYCKTLIDQYLLRGEEQRRRLYCRYADQWLVAHLDPKGRVRYEMIVDEMDQNTLQGYASGLPSPADASSQPYLDRNNHVVGVNQGGISVMSVDTIHVSERSGRKRRDSYSHDTLVSNFSQTQQVVTLPMFTDLNFVEALLATCSAEVLSS